MKNSVLKIGQKVCILGLFSLGVLSRIHGGTDCQLPGHIQEFDWKVVLRAYDLYLDNPSLENAMALLATLPREKPKAMLGNTDEALKYLFSSESYSILVNEAYSGSKYSAEVLFRLANFTDGAYMETILASIGNLIRINPRLFLELLLEYKDSTFIRVLGYPVCAVGYGYNERLGALKYVLIMRIKALEDIKDSNLAEIKTACINQLRECLKRIEE